MRFSPSLILIILFASNPAIADGFLLSRGANIYVLEHPSGANDLRSIEEIESARSMYLPPGTMALQVTDRSLQSGVSAYKTLLSETGVWGLYRPDHSSFFDHDWLNEIKDWGEDQADSAGSHCPVLSEPEQIVLIFPVEKTEVVFTSEGLSKPNTVYPGDVFYNFQDVRRGDHIIGYYPSPLEGFCYEVQIRRSDANIVSILDGNLACRNGRNFGGWCIDYTLEQIRKEYFANTRILSAEREERYSCAVENTVTYTKEQAERIVLSLSARLESEADLVGVQIESSIEVEQIVKNISSETWVYPEEFEILRNFYILADGSDIEVLELWIECPKDGNQIKQLVGNEPHVFYYFAQELPRVSLGKSVADSLSIEARESTGHWLVSSPRQMKTISEYFREAYQLDNEQLHFLQTKVFLWQG